MAFGKRTQPLTGADLRRDPRQAVTVAASARSLAGEPVDIVIEDLSAGGFRASIPLSLREGLLLRVRLPNGRAPHARVVRVEEGRAGCAFVAPLDPETLAMLIA